MGLLELDAGVPLIEVRLYFNILYLLTSFFCLHLCLCSFLDNADRISAPDYIPDDDDILRCRVKTTGVVEVKFQLKSKIFRYCSAL